MYQKIKDIVEKSFNVEILLVDASLLLYSKDDDIDSKILQDINSSISEYRCSFEQVNLKMASLVKNELYKSI